MDDAGTFSGTITRIFYPILSPVFSPVNDFLASHYQPWATLCALGLFAFGASVPWLLLKREFVNVDAPSTKLRHDLRVWTLVALLPHVAVYLYFTKG
jgi:hypothetical protein